MNLGWDTPQTTTIAVLPGDDSKSRVQAALVSFIKEYRVGGEFVYRFD
jgi:hypothetical protein